MQGPCDGPSPWQFLARSTETQWGLACAIPRYGLDSSIPCDLPSSWWTQMVVWHVAVLLMPQTFMWRYTHRSYSWECSLSKNEGYPWSHHRITFSRRKRGVCQACVIWDFDLCPDWQYRGMNTLQWNLLLCRSTQSQFQDEQVWRATR